MKRVIIIAEAGVNHNGSLDNAKKLIDAAADAGADYVKFQTFKTENLVSKSAEKASYQIENTKNNDSQFEMLKKLELSEQDHIELIRYCKIKNIQFFSTAFDNQSIDVLESFGLPLYKIPSGEITNYPYIKKIAALNKKIILSTGMSTLEEINDCVQLLIQEGTQKNNITILHCNTEYPTPMQDVNLMAMLQIRDKFGVEIGYSDHTLGIEVPIAAVALGASIIEKHFTLDRTMEGPDHRASLEPSELKAMVQSIRNIEMALGDGEKKPSASESKNKTAARKSIHYAASINANTILEEKHLTTKRPGSGVSPMQYPQVIGKKLTKQVQAGQIFTWEDLQ